MNIKNLFAGLFDKIWPNMKTTAAQPLLQDFLDTMPLFPASTSGSAATGEGEHNLLDSIRQLQEQIARMNAPSGAFPEHYALDPDTVIIGCVDARLDPETDIGIPDERALIYRNVGAVVAPNDGTAPSNDQGAALSHAIKEKGIRHLIVMGHTCCGGMNACLCGSDKALPAVHEHLKPFHGVRSAVIAKGGDQDSQGRAMEEGSVRQSIDNLMSYPVVAEAVKSGQLQLHGWVINTATKRIKEMNPVTKLFTPIAPTDTPPQGEKPDVMDLVRYQQRLASSDDIKPPEQFPEMLLISNMEVLNPAKVFNIPYGKALILREWEPCAECNRTSQEAALQFAIQGKKVKDIVLMLHDHSDQYKDVTPEEERKAEEAIIRKRINTLKDYPVVAQALASGAVRLHGWIMNSETSRIFELDLHTGQFKPMAGHEAHWVDKAHAAPLTSTAPGASLAKNHW